MTSFQSARQCGTIDRNGGPEQARDRKYGSLEPIIINWPFPDLSCSLSAPCGEHMMEMKGLTEPSSGCQPAGIPNQ